MSYDLAQNMLDYNANAILAPADATVATNIPEAVTKRTNGKTCNLTYEQKSLIIKKRSEDKTLSQRDLAAWAKAEFGLEKTLSQATISNIFRNAEKILYLAEDSRGVKRMRKLICQQLDTDLADWVKMEDKGENQEAIVLKAQSMAAEMKQINPNVVVPVFSNGWLHSFRLRHGFILSQEASKSVIPRFHATMIDDLFVLKKAKRVFDTLGMTVEALEEAEIKVQDRAAGLAANLVMSSDQQPALPIAEQAALQPVQAQAPAAQPQDQQQEPSQQP